MTEGAMVWLILFVCILLFNNFDGYEYDLYDYLVQYLKENKDYDGNIR